MCEHLNFHTDSVVTRITDDSVKGVKYRLDIRLKCFDCGLPFQFIGGEAVSCGFSLTVPTMSRDHKYFSISLKPSVDPVDNVYAILNQ